MADTPNPNDPNKPGPTADNRLAQSAAAGRRVDQPADNKASAAWRDAASAHLDALLDTHIRNSPLAQRTDLYNDAFGHVQALREIFSNAAPRQVAENADAFRSGSNNANV